MRADGDQRAAEAEPVRGLRDLLEIGEVGGRLPMSRAEIGAVAAYGNEPEEVERLRASVMAGSFLDMSGSGVGLAVPDDVADDDRRGDQAEALEAVGDRLLLAR